MSSNYLLSIAGWYFLPNFVTNWAQTLYYRITLRAGDPAPQPGTPQFIKHRKIIYCSVIGIYLLYCIYEADWKLQQDGTFYQDLGVQIDVGEKTLQKTLRRLFVYSSCMLGRMKLMRCDLGQRNSIQIGIPSIKKTEHTMPLSSSKPRQTPSSIQQNASHTTVSDQTQHNGNTAKQFKTTYGRVYKTAERCISVPWS
jgi:hypothetical protein